MPSPRRIAHLVTSSKHLFQVSLKSQMFFSRTRLLSQILSATLSVLFSLELPIHASTNPLRVKDVLYVEDYSKDPIELHARHALMITTGRDGSGGIQNLMGGQIVEIIGFSSISIHPLRYLVRFRQGTVKVEGWVLASELDPIPEEILQTLENKRLEKEKLQEAITRGEIEVGMPKDAVSIILGKPKEYSTIKQADGTFEQWTYTTYKLVPSLFPSVVAGSNYVASGVAQVNQKIPSGIKVITFQNEKVIRIETKKDDMTPYQNGQIVVSPAVTP